MNDKELKPCFCDWDITLKRGTILVGIAHAILTLIAAIFCIIHKVEGHGLEAEAVGWTLIVVCLIMSTVLVYGAMKENKILLKIWLGYLAVMFGLGIIAIIRLVILLTSVKERSVPKYIIAFKVVAVFSIYCARVVARYLMQLTAINYQRQHNYQVEDSHLPQMINGPINGPPLIATIAPSPTAQQAGNAPVQYMQPVIGYAPPQYAPGEMRAMI